MTIAAGDAVVQWLVEGAPGASTSDQVLGRLCAELNAAGTPVARSMVFVRTLHPESMGRWFVWRRATGAVEVGVLPYERQHDFFANGPAEHVTTTGQALRRRITLQGPFESQVLARLAGDGMVDYLALPLRFLDGTIHLFSVATDAPAGFSEADLALFHRLAAPLARLAEILASRRTAANLLDAYVGHGAGERILAGQVRRGEVERIACVVWFSDLRGFTSLSEERSPEQIIAVLNRVFDCQVPAVLAQRGEVLKFIGDGMLAIFPVGDGPPGATCARALAAAQQAQRALAALNAEASLDIPLAVGIALHLGEVAYGNIGGAGRLDFTCIGPAVNLAARVEGLTGRLNKPILVTEAFAAACADSLAPVGAFALKGVERPMQVHEPR